ncbi:MAG: gamma-glutamylcyclotransferase [Methylococcaceae bacterium]|nr:gamma-glutamylcyclotransferase [Methylococcaceae bacterium]
MTQTWKEPPTGGNAKRILNPDIGTGALNMGQELRHHHHLQRNPSPLPPSGVNVHNLFAYGTLQLPEVMLAVMGRTLPAQVARLEGYTRRRISEKNYPGIRPSPGSTVNGLIFVGIDAGDLHWLDVFEDDFYRRVPVEVVTAQGDMRIAQAYVMQEQFYDMLQDEDWDMEDFEREQLAGFLLNHTGN